MPRPYCWLQLKVIPQGGAFRASNFEIKTRGRQGLIAVGLGLSTSTFLGNQGCSIETIKS